MDIEVNVRIFHLNNGGQVIANASYKLGEWTLRKPRIVALRPHPTVPNKMQLVIQKFLGDPLIVMLKEPQISFDYQVDDKDVINEYVRASTGIELATSIPAGGKQ